MDSMNGMNGMDNPESMDGDDRISRKALAIFIATLLVFLGLAMWGGTRIGESRAAEQNADTTSQLTYATDQLSQVRSASASLQKDNDALRAQLPPLQADLSQAQSKIGTVQQDNAALQTQLSAAQYQLSADQTQLSAAQYQLSQMQSTQTALQQDNASLRAQLGSTQSQLSQMQSTQTALQQDNASLRTQVTSWYTWLRSAPPNVSATGATGVAGLVLSPASGPPGATVVISGSGFAASSYGSVFLDINRNYTADTGEPVQYVTTSATGSFSVVLVVPSVSPGSYTVMAGFPAGQTAQASATFTVTTAYTGAGGD